MKEKRYVKDTQTWRKMLVSPLAKSNELFIYSLQLINITGDTACEN